MPDWLKLPAKVQHQFIERAQKKPSEPKLYCSNRNRNSTIHDLGDVRIEDMILDTKHGAERLDKYCLRD